jgi:hypothetical protein
MVLCFLYPNEVGFLFFEHFYQACPAVVPIVDRIALVIVPDIIGHHFDRLSQQMGGDHYC